MDVGRDPGIQTRRRHRRIGASIVAGLLALAVSVVLGRMEPATPTVDRAVVLTDVVTRGSIVREVRGIGTLVPESTRWIPALTEGRVERILLHPGAQVQPHSVILELSNPQVEQDAAAARIALRSAEATLANLRVQLENEGLSQELQVATVRADYAQARLEAEANEALAAEQLVSSLTLRGSQLRASTLQTRLDIEQRRLASMDGANESRLRVQQAAVDSARAFLELQERRLASLRVRAGVAGVLQQLPVEVGQTLAPGTNLARVADPARLKAELRVPETQARDVEVGQSAQIDTHNGVLEGRVTRKDPAVASGTVTVDVTLIGALPRGAVPDLSVDGTIQLERLTDVLYLRRPALAHDGTSGDLFRLRPASDYADRVKVEFGRSSATAIEIVSGLKEGDTVALSDMSKWNRVERVRIR